MILRNKRIKRTSLQSVIRNSKEKHVKSCVRKIQLLSHQKKIKRQSEHAQFKSNMKITNVYSLWGIDTSKEAPKINQKDPSIEITNQEDFKLFL